MPPHKVVRPVDVAQGLGRHFLRVVVAVVREVAVALGVARRRGGPAGVGACAFLGGGGKAGWSESREWEGERNGVKRQDRTTTARTHVRDQDAVRKGAHAPHAEHEVLLAQPARRVGHVRGVEGHVPRRRRVREAVDAFGRRAHKLAQAGTDCLWVMVDAVES